MQTLSFSTSKIFYMHEKRYKAQRGRKLKNYKSEIDLSGLKWISSNISEAAAAPIQGHYLRLSQSLMNVQPHLFF